MDTPWAGPLLWRLVFENEARNSATKDGPRVNSDRRPWDEEGSWLLETDANVGED